jgi:allene oxide cyclase
MNRLTCALALVVPTFFLASAQAAERIQIVERAINETTIDLGTKGDSVGDLLTFANPVFDQSNRVQVGTDQGFCVRAVVGKSWECNWTVTFKEGQITVEGPYHDSGESLFSIIGGTGKYIGARGQMTLRPRTEKPVAYDFVYELL